MLKTAIPSLKTVEHELTVLVLRPCMTRILPDHIKEKSPEFRTIYTGARRSSGIFATVCFDHKCIWMLGDL